MYYVCNIHIYIQTTLLSTESFTLMDQQSFSQTQQPSESLQYNAILNMASFVHGSLSQFLKFKESLFPKTCLTHSSDMKSIRFLEIANACAG